jgi:hypothetical protein
MKAATSAISTVPKTYFLLAPEVKLVKIGQSGNPFARMAALRRMNAADVEILTVVSEKEAVLHERFKHLRHHGEWFRVDPEIGIYLDEISEHEAADRLWAVV